MKNLTQTAARFSQNPASVIDFQTIICRKISTKEDEEQNGFATYVGQAPVSAFLDLPEDENVRQYLLDSGERPKKSGIHVAIEESLHNKPEYFSALNGGICITARKAQLQDDQKIIKLVDPSIINGSQTRGVIRDYLMKLDAESGCSAKAKFELIVTENSELADEISIARNYQITVRPISILGKRGYFNDLALNFKDVSGQGRKLRTSETDRTEDYIKTEKLIQVITALIPESLWSATGRGGDHAAKAFAYSSSAGPLKLFEQVYKEAKEQKKPEALKLYSFYVDIVSDAWALYEKWTAHPGFKGTGWKNGILRDEGGNIINVVDGIVFPMIAALSNFVKHDGKKWRILPPTVWSDKDIISAGQGQFMSVAASNPQTMGKHNGVYQALYSITALVKRLGAAENQ